MFCLQVGRIMLKGDNITLIQSADGQSEGQWAADESSSSLDPSLSLPKYLSEEFFWRLHFQSWKINAENCRCFEMIFYSIYNVSDRGFLR
jgi:hypothetical protein